MRQRFSTFALFWTVVFICQTVFSQTASDTLCSQTTSFNFMSKNSRVQLKRLPIRGFEEYIQLHPSVLYQDGKLHIRGGRADENGFLINGFNVTNPLYNSLGIHIIPEAIERIGIKPGNYEAGYGRANSGLISTNLRQGGENLQVDISFQTDKFASEGKRFMNTYSYREHILVLTADGPITDNLRFFVALENNTLGDYRKRFSSGFQFERLADMNPAKENVRQGQPDTVTLSYPDGFTPENSRNRWAVNSTLSFQYKPFRLLFTGMLDWQRYGSNRRPMLSLTNNREFFYTNTTGFFGVQFDHAIDSRLSYEASIGYYIRSQEKQDNYFGNDWQKWADSSAVYRASNGESVFRDAWRAEYSYLLHGFYFDAPGKYQAYSKDKQRHLSGRLAVTSRHFKHHTIKAGGSYQTYWLRQYSINPFIMAYLDVDYPNVAVHFPSLGDIPYSVASHYMGNTYGYDIQGNETDGARQPVFASAYLQDKWDWGDGRIVAGLRMDYLDMDGRMLDQYKTKIDGKAKSYVEWSPRFTFDFRLSDSYNLSLHYGRYIQAPQLKNIYYNEYQVSQFLNSTLFVHKPIALDLQPVKTNNFQLELTGSVHNGLRFAAALFYKNTYDQVSTGKLYASVPDFYINPNWLVNEDASTARGIEAGVIANLTPHLNLQARYAYTDLKGTGSNEFSNLGTIEQYGYRIVKEHPLDYSHSHRGFVLVDYSRKEGEGGWLFENSGINLLFSFSSGHPYTRVQPLKSTYLPYIQGVYYMKDLRFRKTSDPLNSSRTPWLNRLDLSLYKSFRIYKQVNATFFIRITNLLNTKNTLNVYEATGSSTYDGFINDPLKTGGFVDIYGERMIDIYRAINIQNGQAYWDYLGKELYNHPRQIFVGLRFNY